MTYVISDIHGQYDKYIKMLQLINFSAKDTLYVLGDVIDRGPDGFKILADMRQRVNVIPIAGNHEFMAADCMKWLMQEVTEDSLASVSTELLQGLMEWMEVGGNESITEFRSLSADEKEDILDYMSEFTLVEEVETGGRKFVLVHAGLDNFSEDRPLWDYSIHETAFAKTDYCKTYFKDKFLVTGHRPTRAIYADIQGKDIDSIPPSEYNDTIIEINNHIAIDCGCGYGGLLGCICLETLEKFYA